MNEMNWSNVFSEKNIVTWKMSTTNVLGHSTLLLYPALPIIRRMLPLPTQCFFFHWHLIMFPHCQPPCHTKGEVWVEGEGWRNRIKGAGFLYAGSPCTKSK